MNKTRIEQPLRQGAVSRPTDMPASAGKRVAASMTAILRIVVGMPEGMCACDMARSFVVR